MSTKKINVSETLLIILLFSFCFQNLNIIKFSTFGFKPYHLFSLVFLPLLFKCERIKMPPKFFMFYFAYIIGISVIAYFKYGMNNLFLNYIFGFYLLLIFINVFSYFTFERWLYIIQKAAFMCLIAVVIKDFVYRENIIYFLHHPYGHPVIPTFLGGGPNLEASWIALLGFSFFNNKKGIVYALISLILSAIYSSRVGIIGNVLLFSFLGYQFFFSKNNIDSSISISKQKNNRVFLLLIIVVVGLFVAIKLNIFSYITERFIDIGNDSGSVGRLNMWKFVYESFKKNPFGYGIGNAIKSIEMIAGIDYYESNVHNLFFQKLLDTGFFGAILYLIILFKIFKIGIKKFFKDPFIAFFVSYFILSFVQYRGGDSIFFFMLGVYYSMQINGGVDNNDQNKTRFKRIS